MAAPATMHSTPSEHHIIGAASGADVAARAAAAVLGAAVGDAAALGFHWEYDQKKLAAAVAANGGVSEFAAPSGYHVARKTGDLSMYGEMLLVTLRTVRETGRWNAVTFADNFFAVFGPGGSYVGYADSAMKGIIYTLLDIKRSQGPLFGRAFGLTDLAVRARFFPPGWVALAKRSNPADTEAFAAAAAAVALEANPAASPETLEVVRAAAAAIAPTFARPIGIDETSSDVLAVLPPIAARYAGHRSFIPAALEAIGAITTNADTRDLAAFLARALEAVILGASLHDAVVSNLRHLEQPLRGVIESAVKAAHDFVGSPAAAAASLDALVSAASHWGTSCEIVKGAPVAVFLLLAGGAAPDAARILRANILVGGDSCARGIFIGAALGAARGVTDAPGSIPSAWAARLTAATEVSALAAGIHWPVHGDPSDHVEHVPRGSR